jgi:hypothetical protein
MFCFNERCGFHQGLIVCNITSEGFHLWEASLMKLPPTWQIDYVNACTALKQEIYASQTNAACTTGDYNRFRASH